MRWICMINASTYYCYIILDWQLKRYHTLFSDFCVCVILQTPAKPRHSAPLVTWSGVHLARQPVRTVTAIVTDTDRFIRKYIYHVDLTALLIFGVIWLNTFLRYCSKRGTTLTADCEGVFSIHGKYNYKPVMYTNES